MKQFIVEIHYKEGIETLMAEELALLETMLPNILREMLEQDIMEE